MIIYLVWGIIAVCKSEVKGAAIALWLIGTILSLSFYFIRIHNSCNDFYGGLSGISVDFSEPYCVIPDPVYCPYTMFDGFLDLSKIENIDCSKEFGDKKLLKEMFGKKAQKYNYLALPRVE